MSEQTTAMGVAYCRTCGTPVDDATPEQIAQGLVFCPVHRPVAAAPPPIYTSASAQNPWVSSTPPVTAASTSPALAFILGLFLPGVGAVYNGQYGKGLLHALVTGVIITAIADSPHGSAILPLLLGAWIFYMAFEAMHTSRRRMLGLPVDEFSGLMAAAAPGRRSVFGPLVLIGVGAVMLLNNLDIIQFYQIARYWPLALILLGVYLLYGRVANRGTEADNGRL